MKTVKTVPINEYVALKLEVDRLADQVEQLTARLAGMTMQAMPKFEKGIVVPSGNLKQYIRISDIAMVRAESNYSTIFMTNGNHYFTSCTLKHWTQKCNEPYMSRIHKSYLVNVHAIISFELSTGKVYLKGGYTAHCSETGKKILSGLD